jgi:cytochrome c oxidase cbb3-type subunit 3
MHHRIDNWLCVGALLAAGLTRLGAQAVAPATPPQGRGGAAGQGASVGPRPNVGPADRPPVDAAAADRGRAVWAAECITCHGSQARGTDQAPSLLRSLIVLRDRFGSELGPFLKKGHPTQSGKPSASLGDTQVVDLTHFLRQRIHDTLRGSPVFKEQDIRVGDAKAGATFFNDAGKCSACHSATTGNLAGIGTRYDPVDLQQRMLFPGGGRGGRGRGPATTAVTVTITPPSGASISGTLVQMDDLAIVLRDSSGTARTIRRVPGMKVVKTDPLQAHHELLDRITDKNIHDLVAYLESLK